MNPQNTNAAPIQKKKKEIKVKIYVWPFISDPTEEGLETNQCN